MFVAAPFPPSILVLLLLLSLLGNLLSANNVPEMLTALVSEVAGTTLFAYVIGALVTIVLNLDPQMRLRKQKVHQSCYVPYGPSRTKIRHMINRDEIESLLLYSVCIFFFCEIIKHS